MKKNVRSQNGFSSLHLLLGFVLGSIGLFLGLTGLAVSSGSSLAQSGKPGATALVAAGSKIKPEVLTETANGKSASVVIFLTDQADVSAAYRMKDQDARGWFVYNTLTQHVVVFRRPRFRIIHLATDGSMPWRQ